MRDIAGLGFSLYNWLKREMSNYRKDSYEVDRAGPTVYFRYQDKVILMGFESEKKGEKEFTKFYVHSPDLLQEEDTRRVVELLDYRLNGEFNSSPPKNIEPLDRQESKVYRKIFGDNLPYVARRKINFNGENKHNQGNYDGLSIIAAVSELEGREGGLSDNLFIYGKKGLQAVLSAALKNA